MGGVGCGRLCPTTVEMLRVSIWGCETCRMSGAPTTLHSSYGHPLSPSVSTLVLQPVSFYSLLSSFCIFSLLLSVPEHSLCSSVLPAFPKAVPELAISHQDLPSEEGTAWSP